MTCYLCLSLMETLLAWQPPRTNESRYNLYSFTVPDNIQKHWRERGGWGGRREGGERRTLRDKESPCTCVCVGVARRVGVTCSQENNDIVLNYNVMCMYWNSMLMIYTHSSYFYNVNIQESIPQYAYLDDDLI